MFRKNTSEHIIRLGATLVHATAKRKQLFVVVVFVNLNEIVQICEGNHLGVFAEHEGDLRFLAQRAPMIIAGPGEDMLSRIDEGVDADLEVFDTLVKEGRALRIGDQSLYSQYDADIVTSIVTKLKKEEKSTAIVNNWDDVIDAQQDPKSN